MDRDTFVRIAVNFNLFNLLKDEPEYKKAVVELAETIYDFYEKYRKIKQRYRGLGIGDSDTDKAVADTIYQLIHYGRVRLESLQA